MPDYFQYAVYFRGELVWTSGTNDDIPLDELVIKKFKGVKLPPGKLQDV